MRTGTLFFFIIPFLYISGFAQNSGKITGIVTDDTGRPVVDASVLIEGKGIGTTTDWQGEFEINQLAAGIYVVTVSYMGFEKTVTQVNLSSNATVNLDIKLNYEIKKLQEVTVEDTSPGKNLISRLPFIETNYVKAQIDESASADIGDFLRSSQNINGIRKGGTQIDPVIRGFKYSQLNVQLDGGQKIEGGCPNRMDPASGHVEIEDLESIEVLKGPYALKYGPAFGGLINLVTDETDLPASGFIELHALKGFESNWNGDREHISVTVGNKAGFVRLTGSRKNFGNYKDGNGHEVMSSFRKYNYKSQVGIRPFKNHLLLVDFEEAKGRDIRFPTLPMDERKDDTRLVSADYKINKLKGIADHIFFKIYQSDVRHEMDNKQRPYSDTVVAVSVIDAQDRGLRLESGFRTNIGTLTAGVDLENIKKDGQRDKYMILQPYLPVKHEMLWNNAAITNYGFFAEYKNNKGKWDWIASCRIDYNRAGSDEIVINQPMAGEIYRYGADSISSEFTNFSFSAGITKRLAHGLSVSIAAGRGVRSPDMTERFIILLPVGYDKFDYLGNPKLKPEANNELDLTFKSEKSKFGVFQLNGFYSLVNNYITGRRLPPSQQKPLTSGVLGVKQFYNAGNARLRGFEFSWASPVWHNAGASVFASYTYGTIDKVMQYVLNNQGQVVDDREIKNDALTEIPPFESTVSLYYRLMKEKFIPKLKVRMVAAQNHISQSEYEVSSPGFVVADFSFSFVFNNYLSVNGGVNNILDLAYFEHLNRNIVGTRMNLYEPGRSFFITLFFTI